MFLGLRLTYSEDFGSATRANALSRRTFVLHCDSPRVPDLNLFSAFHTIRLHLTSFVLRFVPENSIQIMISQLFVHTLHRIVGRQAQNVD